MSTGLLESEFTLRVRKIREDAESAAVKAGAEFLSSVIIPYCDRHRLRYLCSNGDFSFHAMGSDHDPPEWMADILDEEVFWRVPFFSYVEGSYDGRRQE